VLNQLAQLPFALAATWEMGPDPLTNIKAERRPAGGQPGILISEKDPEEPSGQPGDTTKVTG
jgi:hypothetical protein